MSVRKVSRKYASGNHATSWVVDYYSIGDTGSQRHTKSFDTKAEAVAWDAQRKIEQRDGLHVPDSKSPTVAEAGALWIQRCEQNDLERSTIKSYREHLDLHITPFIGHRKLNKLGVGGVRSFLDTLHDNARSRPMAKKVVTSLGSLFADAVERGIASTNPVSGLTRASKMGGDRKAIDAGRDFPTPEEVVLILNAVKHNKRIHATIMTLALTGIRAGEIRALRWENVNLSPPMGVSASIKICERADFQKTVGDPKTKGSNRTIPLPDKLALALREWKMKSGGRGIVFPLKTTGKIQSHSNLSTRLWPKAQIDAGVVDAEGKPRYGGVHCLRHWFASWCLNPVHRDGRGLGLFETSRLLGHSNISTTANVYGHLMPETEPGTELDDAVDRLLLSPSDQGRSSGSPLNYITGAVVHAPTADE